MTLCLLEGPQPKLGGLPFSESERQSLLELLLPCTEDRMQHGGAGGGHGLDGGAGPVQQRSSKSWGSRSVDVFDKIEQIGEGQYGLVSGAAPATRDFTLVHLDTYEQRAGGT